MDTLLSRVLFPALCHVLLLSSACHAHSWITCTDYTQQNGDYWDAGLCRAFPRHGHQYTPKTGTFGQDTGYDKSKPASGSPCRTTRDDTGAYNDQHPMAVYYPGQSVVITHPTKNHVADVRCTNKYIPDNGNWIWAGPRDSTADVTLEEFKSRPVADLGTSPVGNIISDDVTTQYPKPGYQNAPKFCENMDKALATNTFSIPDDMQPGRYTFVWGWFFNSDSDLYTSCWETDVVTNRASRDNILVSRGQATTEPVNSSQTMPSSTVSAAAAAAAATSTSAPDVLQDVGVSQADHVTCSHRLLIVLLCMIFCVYAMMQNGVY